MSPAGWRPPGAAPGPGDECAACRFHEVEPLQGLQMMGPSALSSAVVHRALRTVPYPLLGENTLVMSDSCILAPDDRGDLSLMFRRAALWTSPVWGAGCLAHRTLAWHPVFTRLDRGRGLPITALEQGGPCLRPAALSPRRVLAAPCHGASSSAASWTHHCRLSRVQEPCLNACSSRCSCALQSTLEPLGTGRDAPLDSAHSGLGCTGLAWAEPSPPAGRVGDTYPTQHLDVSVRAYIYRWQPSRTPGKCGLPNVRACPSGVQSSRVPGWFGRLRAQLGRGDAVVTACPRAAAAAAAQQTCLARVVAVCRAGQGVDCSQLQALLAKWAGALLRAWCGAAHVLAALSPVPTGRVQDFSHQMLEVGYEDGSDHIVMWLPNIVRHRITPDSPLASWLTPGGVLADADSCILVVVRHLPGLQRCPCSFRGLSRSALAAVCVPQ